MFCIVAAAADGAGAEIQVQVEDPKGRAVEDAVVAAYPVSGFAPAVASREVGIIDQVGKEFVPHVKAVVVGASISFPNGDDIRHHVYSFSDARTFELPLYKGTPTEPIRFDEPGLVVLGCNIHDWMLAYLYVLETPYFALTGKDGLASLADLADGEYRVEVLHPRRKGPSVPEDARVALSGDSIETLSFVLKLKPDFRSSRAPRSGGGDYR